MRIHRRRGAFTLASLAMSGACALLLAGCTSDGPSLSEPPGSAKVGESTACPGEFLYSLANDRTGAGASVQVSEETDVPEFDEIGTEDLACVAKLTGNRTLPSGAPEPDEFVALYTGDLKESITATVESLGFTSGNGKLWRRGGELLSIRTEGAPRLGIDGEEIFTLVSVMDSEELADIRAPR